MTEIKSYHYTAGSRARTILGNKIIRERRNGDVIYFEVKL